MKLKSSLGLYLISFIFLVGCSPSEPKITPKGNEQKLSTKALSAGAKMLQTKAPLERFDAYMVGFHPMKEHPHHQLEAHHFCKNVNEDFTQCTLFDGNTEDANLNGIEYIISEKLFNTLTEEEKKYWHPHNYEILSGQLFLPGLPEVAEKAFLKKKINSYGKTWHVWNTGHYGLSDGTALPLGEAELAWSFNHDGEILKGLEEETQKKFNVNFLEKRNNRKDLEKFSKPQRGVNALKLHKKSSE